MTKREIDVLEYAGDIVRGVQKGVLITGAADGRANPMTISWGTFGIDWGKPVFTTFVRESRFTKTLLDATGEFTVNIPVGERDERVRNILGVCGSKSGRDIDKVAELGLTLEDPQVVGAPGIAELPLTLECRVVYKQQQDLDALAPAHVERWYPIEGEGSPVAGQRDVHTAYVAEVVAAYVIEEG